MLRKLGTSIAGLMLATGLVFVGCGDDDGGSEECGNGVIEGTEECDDTNLAGNDCQDRGFLGGTLACSGTCTFDETGCFDAECGNDTVETGEDCDNTDLDGEDCISRGHTGGTLDCNTNCTFDESGCTDNCGNDTIDVGEEVCDGADTGTDTCITENFDGGTLGCAADCQSLVTTNCCNDACTAADDTQCTGTVLGTCTMMASGCLDWVDYDCDDDGDICDDSGSPSVCRPPCTSDCTVLNATQCISATELETCEDGGDGCMYLTNSTCGSHCGGVPEACFDTGAGLACDDVYNLDGRTFPHTIAGIFDGGVITDPASCSGAGQNPLYASFTVSATAPDEIQITVEDMGSTGPWVRLAAFTTTSATGVCNAALRTELDCVNPSSDTATMTLNASDLGLNPGDVIYFLVHGDGASYTLGDPEVTIVMSKCGNGIIELSEACDDGNATAGDGCSDSCQIEANYLCTGEPSTCVALTTLFTESFSTWPPTGWTIEDGGTTTDTWLQCEAGQSCDNGSFDGANGADGPYALVDSDALGSGVTLAEGLVTPSINCSTYSNVILVFDHNFQKYATDPDFGAIEVSTDGGTNWTQVALYDTDTDSAGEHVMLDISTQAGSQANVMIRFYYTDGGSWDWYWMIDSIQVLGY